MCDFQLLPFYFNRLDNIQQKTRIIIRIKNQTYNVLFILQYRQVPLVGSEEVETISRQLFSIGSSAVINALPATAGKHSSLEG
jgi:hypothetical protein